jgi:hypothetical protein
MNDTGVVTRIIALAMAASLAAGAFAYGGSGGSQWLAMDTEHFTIVYEAPDQGWANEITAFAEEAYGLVTSYFDSYPERVTVILRGRRAIANAMFTWIPPYVELCVSPPLTATFGSMGTDWLRIEFIHEFTHCVHLMNDDSGAARASAFIGSAYASFGMVGLPAWAVEGITTNLETAFSGAGRGRSTYFEALYKACAVGQEFPRLEEASAAGPYVEPPGRHYAIGYVFVAWLRARFGSGIFASIERERHATGSSFEAAVEKATGESVYALYDRMRLELALKYAEYLAIPGGTIVTPYEPGADWYAPSRFLGASALLAKTEPGRFAGVVRLDVATGEYETVCEGISSATFASSADGASLAWTAAISRSGSVDETATRVFLTDASGSSDATSSPGSYTHPSLSDDGRTLVAIRLDGARSELVTIGDPGTAPRGEAVSVWSRADAIAMFPSVSPDGSSVAFVASTAAGWELVVLALEAGIERRYWIDAAARSSLFEADGPGDRTKASLSGPRWASDGSLLVASDARGSWEGFRLRLEEGVAIPVANDPAGVLLTLEGNGSLWYSAYTHRGFVLKRVDPETGAGVPLDQSPIALGRSEPEAIERGPIGRFAKAAAEAEPAIPARRFIDVPRHVATVAFPAIVEYDGDIAFGFALAHASLFLPLASEVYGGGALAAIAYYPTLGQFDGAASAELKLGGVDVGAYWLRAFGGGEATGFSSADTARIALSIDASEADYRSERAWSAEVGAHAVARASAPYAFPAFDPSVSIAYSGALYAGVSWASRLFLSPEDTIGAYALSATGYGGLLGSIGAYSGGAAAFGISARLPLLGPFGAGLAATASWSSGGPEACRPDPVGFRLPDSGSDWVVSIAASLLAPFSFGTFEFRAHYDVALTANGPVPVDGVLYLASSLMLGYGFQAVRVGIAWSWSPQGGLAHIAFPFVEFTAPFAFDL